MQNIGTAAATWKSLRAFFSWKVAHYVADRTAEKWGPITVGKHGQQSYLKTESGVKLNKLLDSVCCFVRKSERLFWQRLDFTAVRSTGSGPLCRPASPVSISFCMHCMSGVVFTGGWLPSKKINKTFRIRIGDFLCQPEKQHKKVFFFIYIYIDISTQVSVCRNAKSNKQKQANRKYEHNVGLQK